MRLNLPQDRLDDRRNLLTRLDGIRRSIDAGGSVEGMDRFQQQAFDTILGGVADAFDLSKEDPRTVERYDTAPLVRPDQISKAWNNYNNYVDNAKTLGKLLLLARRLCEAGCGFVTVTTNFVWDMHADVNNATLDEGMQYMGLPLDHAVSAFIEDTRARGLDDKILLVCSGEMGRTPKINARGGRDHWGGLTPLLLSGGGLNMGQVIGQSTRDAGEPHTEPLGIDHLLSNDHAHAARRGRVADRSHRSDRRGAGDCGTGSDSGTVLRQSDGETKGNFPLSLPLLPSVLFHFLPVCASRQFACQTLPVAKFPESLTVRQTIPSLPIVLPWGFVRTNDGRQGGRGRDALPRSHFARRNDLHRDWEIDAPEI